MSDVRPTESGTVTVRYWAGARAAAGVETEQYPVADGATLATLLAQIEARHGPGGDLSRALAVCSFLVDDLPVARSRAADASVEGAAVIEALPPFAGGSQ